MSLYFLPKWRECNNDDNNNNNKKGEWGLGAFGKARQSFLSPLKSKV